MIVVLLGLAVGCAPASFPDVNVLMIGIDTLRADHLGCYGYRRPTSPRIDALSGESILFTTAISQSPWTLPSFASIFTGLLPSSHRAGEGKVRSIAAFTSNRTTMAEALRAVGYRTGSFVSNHWAGPTVGLGHGFEYAQAWPDAAKALADADKWIRDHHTERFFAFLHLVDPHQPYTPPAEDAEPFIDHSYSGPVGMSFLNVPRHRWTEADRRRIVDLYDGEIRYSDRLVGRVLELLGNLGVLERTVVVIVADHGEELFERGAVGHGGTLFDEVLRVPLLIRFPGARLKGRIEEQVRTMDIYPTLLDAVTLPVPVGLDGVSLMPLIRSGSRPPNGKNALAEYLFYGVEKKAIRREGLKLIFTPETGMAQLYNLVVDPGERDDVAATEPVKAADLRVQLQENLVHLEGFHLVIPAADAAHEVRVRGRCDAGFLDVTFDQPPGPQGNALAPDGRMFDAALKMPPRQKNEGGTRTTVRFRTRGGAPVTLDVMVDGAPLQPRALLLGSGADSPPASGPWVFGPTDDRLVVPDPPVVKLPPSGEFHVALFAVHRPPLPVAHLDEKTREGLRALGYIE